MTIPPGHVRPDGPADQCATCATPLLRTAGESLIRGRIEWHLDTSCTRCGYDALDCGNGIAPEPIRGMLLEQTGTWVARTVGPAPGTAVMRALRKVYGIGLAEARELSDRLNGSGLSGTRGESLFLQQQLAALGIDAAVEPGPDDVARPGSGSTAVEPWCQGLLMVVVKPSCSGSS